MHASGITLAQLREVVEFVSENIYEGNLELLDPRESGVRVPQVDFRLFTKNSRKPGHRLAYHASYARYMPNSCPHCHKFVTYGGWCGTHGKVQESGYRDVTDAQAKAHRKRLRAACWHAHRDVMLLLFNRYPKAKLRTSMAQYNGMAGFLENYPPTGRRNIGSQVEPMLYRDACECCNESHPEVP